jgi:hypothetical protein
MQTLIHVIGKGTKSLRDRVVNDPKLEDFGLVVSEFKRKGRPQGWAKLHMNGAHGAINIEWHASSRLLLCRAVTKGGKPHDIVGAFITFLIAHHQRQILSIQILSGTK